MGSCSSSRSSSRWIRDPFVPMYLLPVQTFLELEDLPHHEELMKARKLVKRNPHLQEFCIFVSHQWLSRTHPDPEFEQLPVLQKALRNLIDGHSHAQSDVAAQFFGENRKLSAKERRQLATGFLWLDWFCIPQEAEMVDGLRSSNNGIDQDDLASPRSLISELHFVRTVKSAGSTQDMYISCIPFFVEICDLFLALVPRSIHKDTRQTCNFQSWLTRGWCRMEMWCSILSVKADLPFLVVKGCKEVSFAPQMLVADRPPHEGAFSLDRDRKTIRYVMQRALENRIVVLKDLKQWDLYRFTLARYETLLGEPWAKRSLDDFMRDFCFTSLETAKSIKGLGPVECAILSHDHQLIPYLATAGFQLSRNVYSKLNIATLQSGRSTLDYALEMSWRSNEVLRDLLHFSADVNRPDQFGWVPLGACKTVTAVQMLVQHQADVNKTGGPTHVPPLTLCAVRCSPASVLKKLIECRANLEPPCLGVSPPHALANLAIWSAMNPNCLEAAQLLLDARSDVNLQRQGKGMFRMVELLTRAYTKLHGPSWGIEHFLAESSTTPLGFACFCGGDDYVEFLLLARADPEIRNARGNNSLQLARSQTVVDMINDFQNTFSI